MKTLRIFWQEFMKMPRNLRLLALATVILFAVVEIIAIFTYLDLAIMLPIFLICLVFFLINLIVWDTSRQVKK